MCFRAAAGSLTLRWWPGRTREFGEAPSDPKRDKPCRVEVRLSGLEVLWFNNVASYERLAAAREGRAVEIVGQVAEMVQAARFKIPGLYKISPAISVSISVGCVMLGNPDLPTVAVFSFHRARGVHWAGPPSQAADYYRRTTNLEVRRARLKIVRNPDWSPGREIAKNPADDGSALSMMSRLCEGGVACTNPDSQPISMIRKQTKAPVPGGGPATAPLTTTMLSDVDFALGAKVLGAKSASFTYYEDIPGPVTAQAAREPFDPETAPQWGVEATFRNTKIQYGPWADRQRTLLFNSLFPPDYSTATAHRPVEGTPRACARFRTGVAFEQKLEWTIPFRDPARPPTPSNMSDIKIACQALSKASFANDLVAATDAGFGSRFTADLMHCSVETSLNRAPILTSDSLVLAIDIRFPPVFNHVRRWDCRLSLQRSQLFFLFDHLGVFRALVADLFASDREPTPADGTCFVPNEISFTVDAVDTAGFLNANEMNVISKPNDLDENVHFVATVPKLTATIGIPFIAHQAAKRNFTFDAKLWKGCLSLLLPSFNTCRQSFDPFESNVAWRSTGDFPGVEAPAKVLGIPFIWADAVSLSGSYEYYLAYGPEFLETLYLSVDAGPGDVQLFGFFLTYILCLQSNYLGGSQHVAATPGQEFPGEDPGNPIEVYLTLNAVGANLHLPIGMYRAKPFISGVFDNLLLELRAFPTYFDLALCLSPISVRFPGAPLEYETPLCRAFEFKGKDIVTINDFSFRFHFMFGPRPPALSYRETYNLHIGTVTGNCLAAQLTCLATYVQNFLYHYKNHDNRAIPPVTESDSIFVTFAVEIGAASLYLWGSSTVTHLEAKRGATIVLNTFVTHLHNSKASISIPEIAIRHFAPSEGVSARYYTDLKDWTETGAISGSLSIAVFVKDPTWQEDAEKQSAFLRSNDSEAHRLPFLWEAEEKEEEKDDGAAEDTPTKLSSVSAALLHKSSALLDVPDPRQHTRKPSQSTPRAAAKTSEDPDSPSAAGLEEEDDMFLTAKSTLSSPSDSDHEKGEGGPAKEKTSVVEAGESGSGDGAETPTTAGRSDLFLRSPLVEHCDFVERREPLAVRPELPSHQFLSRHEAAMSFGKALVGRVQQPRSSFLYINDSGVKSAIRSSRAQKRRRAEEAVRDGWKSELATLHRNTASSVSIVIDSLSEVRIFLTPLALRAYENLALSLALNVPSAGDLIDSLQSSAVGKSMKAAKFSHERVQLIASFDRISIRTAQFEQTGRDQVVIASRAVVEKTHVCFALCKKYSPAVTKSSSAKTLSAQQEDFCSLLGSFSVESAALCLNSLSRERAQAALGDERLHQEKIDSLVGVETETGLIATLGCVSADFCSRGHTEGEIESDVTVDVLAPTLRTNNDVGAFLAPAIVPFIAEAQRIACVARHLAKSPARLCRGLVVDVLAAQMNSVSLPGVPSMPLSAELFALCDYSGLHRRSWREVSLLRSFVGRDFEPPVLRKEAASFELRPSGGEAKISAAYKEAEERIAESAVDSPRLQQLQDIARSSSVLELFRPETLRKPVSMAGNARVRITPLALTFEKQHFETKASIQTLSIQINATSDAEQPPVRTVTAAVVIDDASVSFGPSAFDIGLGFLSLAREFRKLPDAHPLQAARETWAAREGGPTPVPLDLCVRLSLSSLKCHATSSEFGTLVASIRSASASGSASCEKRLVSTVVLLPLVSMELADSASISRMRSSSTLPACVSLTVRGTSVSQAILSGNERGEEPTVCDVAVRVDSVDSGFTVSEHFLAKVQGFVKEWTTAISKTSDEISATTSAPPQPVPAAAAAPSAQAPRRIALSGTLDVGTFRLGSDIIPSLPFRYEAARIFFGADSNRGEASLQLQLIDHHLSWLDGNPASESAQDAREPSHLALPSLRAVGKGGRDAAGAATCVDGRVEIGAWRTKIDSTLVTNILALQWRMSREIDDLLEAWTRFQARKSAAKRKRGEEEQRTKSPQMPSAASPLDSLLKNLRWTARVDIQGVDLVAVSPATDVALRFGKIAVLLRDAPPAPDTLIPFSWRLDLSGLSASVGEEKKGSRKEGPAWASLRADISFRNFAVDQKEERRSASTKNDSAFVTITRTELTAELGAMEKVAAAWLHFVSAVMEEKSKLGSLTKVDGAKVQRALRSVEVPTTGELSERTVSLDLQILDTTIVFPFGYPPAGSPGIVMSLAKLQLLGNLSKTFPCKFADTGKTAPGRKVVGSCAFAGAHFAFVDDCSERPDFREPASRPAVCSSVEAGRCNVVIVASTLFSAISTEFDSLGAHFSLSAKLIYFLALLKSAIVENQRRLMTVVDSASKKQHQHEPQEAPAPPTPAPAVPLQYGISLDARFRSAAGLISLRRMPEAGSASSSKVPWHPPAPKPRGTASSEEVFSTVLPSIGSTISLKYLPEPSDPSGPFETKIDLALSFGESEVLLTPFVTVLAAEVAEQFRLSAPIFGFGQQMAIVAEPPPPAGATPQKPVVFNGLLHIGTVSTEFRCAPFSEVVCKFVAGPVDSFTAVTISDKTSVTASAGIPSATLKLHHAQFPEQSTWLSLSFLTANFSTTCRPFNALVVYAGDFSCGLNVDRVQEIAQCYKVWLTPLLDGLAAGAGKRGKPQSTDEAHPPPTATSNLILDVGFASASAELELGQWVGSAKLKLGRTAAGLYVVPVTETVVDASAHCEVEGVELECRGKLAGIARVDGVTAWSQINSAQSQWEALLRVLPVAIAFEYAGAPILSLRGGDLTVSHLGRNDAVSSHIGLRDVGLQISPETIATAITIASKVSETVTEQLAILRKPPASLEPARAKLSRPPCRGDIGMTVSNVNIWLFEAMRDSSWFSFTVAACALRLKVAEQIGAAPDLTRDLVLEAEGASLSQATEGKKKPKKAKVSAAPGAAESAAAAAAAVAKKKKQGSGVWKRKKQEVKVFSMPTAKLVMRTKQVTRKSRETDFWFESAFEKPIFVSLDIRHYQQLRELAETYATRVSDELARLSRLPSVQQQQQQQQQQAAPSQSLSARPAKAERVFRQHSFVLEPVLSVLSDLTPSVSTVLAWAGIETPSITIPKLTHQFITETLERPLRNGVWLWAARESLKQTRHALSEEQEKSRSLEKKVSELEASLKSRDMSLREALESVDKLEFANQRLSKRLSEPSSSGATIDPPDLSSSMTSSSSGGGGWLGFGKGKAEMQKMREEMAVMKEELEFKITENVSLHVSMSEQKEEFERVVALMEQKAANVKATQSKRVEEIDIALRVERESSAKIAEERDQLAEALRGARLEIDAVRSAAVEKEQQLSAAGDALSLQLRAARAQVAEKIAFDDTKNVQWTRLNVPQRLSTTAASAEHGPARARAAAFLRTANAIEAESRPGIPYEEALRERQLNADFVERSKASNEKIERLEADLNALRAERRSLLRQLEEAHQRVVAASKTSTSTEITPTTSPKPKETEQQQDSPTAAASGYTISVVDPGSGSPMSLRLAGEERERERLLKQHYEALMAHTTRKAHLADNRASEMQKECESARAELAKTGAELIVANATTKHLEDELASVREDLEATRRGYDQQIQVMSEHIAGLNETLSKLDEESTSVKGCKVKCGRCNTWNTIQYLLGEGAGGKQCSGGSHPTLTFMR